MRDKLIGITILGVLTYMIYKHYKKAPTIVPVNVPIYTPVEIDPSVYSKPVVSKPPPLAKGYIPELNPVYTRTEYKAPYDILGFGMDRVRNTDSIDPDSYLYMPLESEGITHMNKDLYKDIEEEPMAIPTRFKYIRIKFKAIRSSNHLSLGGVRFLLSRKPIEIPVQIWNPHTGAKSTYSGGDIKDSDQMTFVFIFSEPAQVNRYEFKTSLE